jgi:hypothetical protein
LAQLTSRISAIVPPQKPSDDAETAEKQQGRDGPHSEPQALRRVL